MTGFKCKPLHLTYGGIRTDAVMLKKPTFQYLTDKQKMKKANASAKSKEMQSYPKADAVASYLLLPQHTKTLLCQ